MTVRGRSFAGALAALVTVAATASGSAAQEAIDWTEVPPAVEPGGPPSAVEIDPREVGMDPELLRTLDAVIDSALARGAAPGAALAIGRYGRLVRLRGYGTLDGPGSPGVGPETIWDLASLTKVVGTTSAVMMLVDEGRLDLQAPVVRYLPGWDRGDPRKAEVTIRQLLLHRAGLPAFRRWFVELDGREAYERAIADEPLDRAPGGETVYSDIGVMTLALVVERLAGMPLDTFLQTRLFDPLGMSDTGFAPRPDRLRRIAPTEIDPRRGGKMHGRVHDENADAFGGVAGHAGLFSSARDLAAFAQLMLDGGVARACEPSLVGTPCRRARRLAETLIDPATVSRFTLRWDGSSTRAFGWDTPSDRSSAGDWFSSDAFGHTGYTGTSIWIDPDKDLFVVLLTNRVNPTRENTRHAELRRTVHDIAARAITDRPISPRPGSPTAEGGR